MRLLLLLLLAACGRPAAPKGPTILLINETGVELRDVWVGQPGGPSPQAPLAVLKAGAQAQVLVPAQAAKLSVVYRRAPDVEVEATVPVLEVKGLELHLRPKGVVKAQSAP